MRRFAERALLALLLTWSAGCQNYNFNPVNQCLIQPGTAKVTLASYSTADVLFVVDDSGSMQSKQDKLGTNFSSFIGNIDTFNANRVASGLEAFDFHIAVTTTSVSYNPSAQATCRTDCGNEAGKAAVCCGDYSNRPILVPKTCTADSDCAGSQTSQTCQSDCYGLLGGSYCCDSAKNPSLTEVVPCTDVGLDCGENQTNYAFSPGCVAGVAADQYAYPQGEFVSFVSPAGAANPRVLHFDKQLYNPTGTNRQGYSEAELEGFFATPASASNPSAYGNVLVGTCGSDQEQGLNAAQMAVEKALQNQQFDTVDLSGNAAWTPGTRTASASAEWPHPNSKLVLVFLGDEDDCSSTVGANESVVMEPGDIPGSDACTRDASQPQASQRQTNSEEFINYFVGLGRPLGAAFIESTSQTICGRPDQNGLTTACTPGLCCDTVCTGSPSICRTTGTEGAETCGGQAAANRFFQVAEGLAANGADVVSGSVCDPDFSTLLDSIANIVRPPEALILPSEPAEGVVTELRIADSSGETVVRGGVAVICKGPAPTTLTTLAAAQASNYDWWFTATRDPGPPVLVSQYIYINHGTGNCEANPGQSYEAQYIALLPASGCQTRNDCQAALGGRVDDWGCYVPNDGLSVGTCICCASGSTVSACQ